MINWILENWYYVVFFIVVAVGCVYGCMTGKVKEWLKYAVSIAEKDLGSGTGQLKLRQVYDMFIDKFPAFSSILPFPIFSKMVDTALEWMEIQLNSNANFKNVVGAENAKN